MEEVTAASVLGQKGLKKTKLRLDLLACFLEAKAAVSYTDIQSKLAATADKSTVYRNLTTFEEAGIIHRIQDQSGLSKYAFGKNNQDGQEHAHFICEVCETVYCLGKPEDIPIQVPTGFKKKELQIFLKGVCAKC